MNDHIVGRLTTERYSDCKLTKAHANFVLFWRNEWAPVNWPIFLRTEPHSGSIATSPEKNLLSTLKTNLWSVFLKVAMQRQASLTHLKMVGKINSLGHGGIQGASKLHKTTKSVLPNYKVSQKRHAPDGFGHRARWILNAPDGNP